MPARAHPPLRSASHDRAAGDRAADDQVAALATELFEAIRTESFVGDADYLQTILPALSRDILAAGTDARIRLEAAREAGEALGAVHHVSAEAIGDIVQIIGRHLAHALRLRGQTSPDVPLPAILGQVVAGFVAADRRDVLVGQTASYGSLLRAQRDAEEALRRSEERYRAVAAQAAEGIVIVDALHQRIVESNASFQRLLGYSEGELVGKPLREILAGDQPALNRRIAEVLRRGRGRPAPRSLRRKDGTIVRTEVSSAVLNIGGEALLCGVVRDMTPWHDLLIERERVRREAAGAREEERLRLAHDLHDGPLQTLVGARFRLRAAEDATCDARVAAEVAGVIATMSGVIKQLRAMHAELRPVGLERGLQVALENFVRLLASAGARPAITLQLDGVDELSPEVALCLFRVAQEAVRNAMTHGQAARIAVRCRRRADWVSMVVADDGLGFDYAILRACRTESGHFGLAGMEERVSTLGGRLRIFSRRGRGSTVAALVPVEP